MIGRAAPAAAAALLAACAVAPRVPYRPAPASRPPTASPAPARHDDPDAAGVVHVVRRGETVYRIARTYGISPADLMQTNGIVDPRAVEVGTELFVPGAARVLEVPPLSAAPAPASAPAPVPAPPPLARPAPSPGAGATPRPAPAPPPAGGGDPAVLSWPVKGVLYQRFGATKGRRHDGIDLSAPEGTPVLAAADGTVVYAGEQAGYGAIVIVRHPGALLTLYAHASALLVHEGETVRRGQPIARVGQTGKTTGPHLHFEVREGTRPRNPLLYLR